MNATSKVRSKAVASTGQAKPLFDHGFNVAHLHRGELPQAPQQFCREDGQHALDIEGASIEEANGETDFKSSPAGLGSMGKNLNQRVVTVGRRDTHHQHRPHFGGQTQIGKPNLASFRSPMVVLFLVH